MSDNNSIFRIIVVLLFAILCFSVMWLDERLNEHQTFIERMVKIHPEAPHDHQD